MEILLWILLGGLAGWLASMIVGRDAGQGVLGNVVVGILGAVVGGWIADLIGFREGASLGHLDWVSFLIAIGGAVVLLWLWGVVRGDRSGRI